MPTSTQHLKGATSSICHSFLRRRGGWHLQQLSPNLFYGSSSVMGGSWVKIAAHKSAENTELPEKRKKRRFPFSISWENTKRGKKPICTYYAIARKYVGDLGEGLGVI